MNALNVLNGRGDLVKSVDLTPHLTPKRVKRRDKESYNFMDVPNGPTYAMRYALCESLLEVGGIKRNCGEKCRFREGCETGVTEVCPQLKKQ
jgi:hypothetical protein